MSAPAGEQLELSIVIPVYGAEGIVAELHRRLTETLESLVGDSYEIVLVEDRSPDASWSEVRAVATKDDHVRAIRLSRNFGQLPATTAGLDIARGTWIAIMDCDLQDRPEDLERLFAEANRGFDIVQARRAKQGAPLLRRLGTRTYFWILRIMTGVRIDWELAAFTIMHSKVKDAFLSVTDRDRNLLLVLSWLGFSTTAVDVAHDPRFAGKSSYSLRKLVAYAFDGVFFQTVAPLRWIIYSGFLIAFGAVIAMAFLILQWLRETTYPGWTSLMTVLLFLGGTILASLGIVGIYVGKVFDQVKGRPVYVVDERINAAEEPAG